MLLLLFSLLEGRFEENGGGVRDSADFNGVMIMMMMLTIVVRR